MSSPSIKFAPLSILGGLLIAFGVSCGGGEYDDRTEGTPEWSPSPTAETTPTPGLTPTPQHGWVVDPSNPQAFQTINDALEYARDGDTIRVFPGTYTEQLSLGSYAVQLVSEGSAGETRLRLPEDCTGNCAVLRVVNSGTRLIEIEGFTVEGGKGHACPVSEEGASCGGGLFMRNANLHLQGMVFMGNGADVGGGAYFELDDAYALTVDNTVVIDNDAKSGGGLYLKGGLQSQFTRLQLSDNRASLQGGGLQIEGAALELTNFMIGHNEGVVGGGLSVSQAQLTLSYGVIAHNRASLNGGGLELLDQGQVAAAGIILSENQADGQGSGVNFNCAECSLDLTYSDIHGENLYGGAYSTSLELGTGVMELDPRFLSPENYRLQDDSPCINKGPKGDEDVDGSRADLGAFGSPGGGLWDLDDDGHYAVWFDTGTEVTGTWDCDDQNADIHPDHAETCDGKDTNCDGELSEMEADQDGDGYHAGCGDVDCNDLNPDINPGAEEGVDGNGVDDDCDETIDEGTTGGDADGDGYCPGYENYQGELKCGVPWNQPGDCDDSQAHIHPGSEEICDGLDSDCDGAPNDDEVDKDGDGYMICDGDVGEADTYDTIHPEAAEAPNGLPDNVDNDLDGTVDEGTTGYDDDGDGYCEWMDVCNTGANGADCDDSSAAIGPHQPEICDGVDTNCDGQVDADESDSDKDGYRVCEGDCDDNNAQVHPGAVDYASNGIDEDCDGWDRGAVGWGGDDISTSIALSCAHSRQDGAPLSAFIIAAMALGYRLRREERV